MCTLSVCFERSGGGAFAGFKFMIPKISASVIIHVRIYMQIHIYVCIYSMCSMCVSATIYTCDMYISAWMWFRFSLLCDKTYHTETPFRDIYYGVWMLAISSVSHQFYPGLLFILGLWRPKAVVLIGLGIAKFHVIMCRVCLCVCLRVRAACACLCSNTCVCAEVCTGEIAVLNWLPLWTWLRVLL